LFGLATVLFDFADLVTDLVYQSMPTTPVVVGDMIAYLIPMVAGITRKDAGRLAVLLTFLAIGRSTIVHNRALESIKQHHATGLPGAGPASSRVRDTVKGRVPGVHGPSKLRRLRRQTKPKTAETVETFLSGKEISDKNEAHEDDPQCDCSGSTQNAISVANTDCTKLLNAQIEQGKEDLKEAKRNCNADINEEVQEEQRKTQQEKDAKTRCMRSWQASDAENQKLKDIDRALALVEQKYTICLCLSCVFAILLALSWWPELSSGLSNWQRRMDEVQQCLPQQGADGEHDDGNKHNFVPQGPGPARATPHTAAANADKQYVEFKELMAMFVKHIMQFVKAEPVLHPLTHAFYLCCEIMDENMDVDQRQTLLTKITQAFIALRAAEQAKELNAYIQRSKNFFKAFALYEVELDMQAGAAVRADNAANAGN